jgi:hypothetical protein
LRGLWDSFGVERGRACRGAWECLQVARSPRRVERLWVAFAGRLGAADAVEDRSERLAEDGTAAAEALKFFWPEF